MEMFFLSYVNNGVFTLDSVFLQVSSSEGSEPIMAQQTSMF